MSKNNNEELYKKAKYIMETFNIEDEGENEDAPYGTIVNINPIGITSSLISLVSWAMASGAIDEFSKHLEKNSNPEVAIFTRWGVTYAYLEWERIASTKAENNFLDQMKGLLDEPN